MAEPKIIGRKAQAHAPEVQGRSQAKVLPGARPSRRVLHVGCGESAPHKLHPVFAREWAEVRLDIDPRVKPDIVASITNMTASVPDNSVDAIWSSHNVEHLHSFEVPTALREFTRVLRPTGFALITCPDLEQVARFILSGVIDKTVYTAPAGPVTPLDMLFGYSRAIQQGNLYMCHKTGFTEERLASRMLEAGFVEARTRKGKNFDFWCVAFMKEADRARIIAELLQAGLDFRENAPSFHS